jgi:hypothetical protein
MNAVTRTLLLALLAALPLAAANPGDDAAQKAAALRVAQQFYDWYTPIALAETKQPACEIAVAKKESLFSPQLVKALREDFDVRKKAWAKGDADGLDFDPFLSSQDPCEHYVVTAVTWKDGTWRAEVHGICAGKREPKPSVIAALTRTAAGWQFVNFYYPGVSDLLKTLKLLHPEHH